MKAQEDTTTSTLEQTTQVIDNSTAVPVNPNAAAEQPAVLQTDPNAPVEPTNPNAAEQPAVQDFSNYAAPENNPARLAREAAINDLPVNDFPVDNTRLETPAPKLIHNILLTINGMKITWTSTGPNPELCIKCHTLYLDAEHHNVTISGEPNNFTNDPDLKVIE
jgi:hypothetical protein